MQQHSLTRTREARLNRTAWRLSALLLSAAMLAACSGNVRDVYGEPPQISIDGLEKRPEGVIVELAMRNVNDSPLSLETTSITLTLDGEALAVGERELPLTISARGRDVIRLSLPADPAGLALLEALAAGEVQRLPWALETRLTLAGSRDRRTKADGWLHPVPGQPNRFR